MILASTIFMGLETLDELPVRRGDQKKKRPPHLEPVVFLVGTGPFGPVVRAIGLGGCAGSSSTTDGAREIDEQVDVVVVSDPEGSRRSPPSAIVWAMLLDSLLVKLPAKTILPAGGK